MTDPKCVLSKSDYANYRNVRAVAVLFAVVGVWVALVGVARPDGPDGRMPPAAGAAVGAVGLAGLVGGIAALNGNRRWARLAYLMAAVYLFACPVGTILSLVMLIGLVRYLCSVEQVHAASAASEDPAA